MKKFIILNKELEYEYDITVEETDNGIKTTLFNSSSSVWSESAKGKEILSMLNDGNGIKFSHKIGKKLNYSELAELRLLLNVENAIDIELNQDGYKILEEFE
jgi:hypothetical protein